MIKAQDIFNGTNGGLDIILDLHPAAKVCISNPKAKFKKRESEATPSAHIFKKDGIWYLKDFGETGKGLNAIKLWMEAHFMDESRFGEACMQIGKRWNIKDELDRSVNRPTFVKRAATSDEPDGVVVFRLKEQFSKEELEFLGPKVTQETVDALHWYSVEWIGRAKDRQITEKHSTPTYPIFIRECIVQKAVDGSPEKKFYKQYEPKNTEKQYRFMYFPTGEKEENYINGLMELQEAHAAYVAKERKLWEAAYPDGDKPFNESKCKLPEVIICSGERDALCCRSHGYHPVWLNSETAMLTAAQMKMLRKYAEVVYNIPDVDATGIRAGKELAKKFIDLYTVWLPMNMMKRFTDHRGKNLNDLRDWCDIRQNREDFRELLMMGKPAKFWVEREDKNGRKKYEIDTEYLFHFLQLNGYYILHDENSDDPRFIHIEGNVVKTVTPRDIRAFARRWVSGDGRTQHHDVRNLILNTPRLSPMALEALQETELNFDSFTPDSQLFFFRNGTANVTAEKVEWMPKRKQVFAGYVWEDNVIKHDFHEFKPMFDVKVNLDADGSEEYELDILDAESSKFFGYLINSSRIYWRKEMELPFSSKEDRERYQAQHRFDICGERLSAKEIEEQRLCLLSKMFALGYVLHQYKSPDRAWALMAMDAKIGENDECNGRSGKSFFYTLLGILRRKVDMSGRSGNITRNDHWLDGVDQYTQLLQIDDLDERMPASFFYDIITGSMTVNPKNNHIFTIPFSKSPKIGFTTNYVPSDFDPSSDARMIYMVYSDYYHQQTSENDYLETRSIRDDFGKALYTEAYTEEEWAADFAFAMQCVRFYLQIKRDYPNLKIQPPMENIRTRKLKRDMGENFEEWAYQYFAEDSGHLDTQLVRTEVFEDYKRYSNVSTVKMKSFTRKLRAFAQVCPYIYEIDPEEYRNGQGRNIVSKSAEDPLNPTKTKTVEMVFVRSVEGEKERRMQMDSEEPF
ncbi:MAG: hypothetical protein IKR05_08500 [Prevotella sp.]|nr:hypothetical protein [Prevotella sp.]